MKTIHATLIISFLFGSLSLYSQGNKTMDEAVYSEWNRITDTKISQNGDWVMYTLEPGYGDKNTVLYNTRNQQEFTYERSEEAMFDSDGNYVYFLRKPSIAHVKEEKRKKTKDKDMPGDTLVIVDLTSNTETTFPNISSFKIPEKAGPVVAAKIRNDDKPKKKENSKDGKQSSDRIIYIDSQQKSVDTLLRVTDFAFAEESTSLMYSVKADSTTTGGVFIRDGSTVDTIFSSSGKLYQLAINKDASQAAFVVDADTTDIIDRPYQLYHWNANSLSAKEILHSKSENIPDNWTVSNQQKPSFSDDGSRLFFGITPYRLQQDTSKLKEEIVNVEVWHYQQPKLYTQQELDEKDDNKKSYQVAYSPETNKMQVLHDKEIPDIRMDENKQASHALLYTDLPYKTHETWQGYAERDVYKVNIESGQKIVVATAVHGRPQLSPEGAHIFWYDLSNSSWHSHNVKTNQTEVIGNAQLTTFHNELHDAPSYPRSYGIAGWTKNDEFLIANDRYDLWLLDPNNAKTARNLTNGREDKIRYRYIELDEDEEHINLEDKILLHVFDEKDKSSGYATYDFNTDKITSIGKDDFSFTTNVIKAENSDDVIYTKQSFSTFPNLIHDNLSFENPKQISDANPQQNEYKWGTNQLYSWTAFDGQSLDGVLVLPQDFDPEKKYPLLVNFYERSSDRLHRHRPPSAGRSTINYSFYVNRGYIIFNPDVTYTIGDPGESCYNAVISGIAALLAEGFIDKDRIGVQGHSWGGYQVAHLVTKTDVFACAESGAPLVNMISAYGGIRWGTGRSRQFQYEKTQSRLGVTLWESPETYIRNSPLFFADKINTPVLIMHNDADGHVPWHLGIEFFMALRRLQKPSWFLNYNGEPHWPLKWQNRLDFNIRMQQYFDHYLMDAPMPDWMKNGIPAIEKGIRSGYETDSKVGN